MGDHHGRPRYRPEAMARLRRGFEAQAERRRRKQAPRIAYGQRLAAEQGLGQLSHVFRLHRRAWWWAPGLIVLFVLLVAVYPGFVTWRTPLERIIALLPWAGGWVLLIVLMFSSPGRNEWIYCCDAGFVHARHRARALRVTRWDQVVAVYRAWASKFNPSEEDFYSVPAGPVLVLDDGANLSLSRDFENVLDPWASPMRGGFEAMRPVGEVLPRFPSLADALERGVTGRLLPPAMAAYERGEVVWFGSVGVGRQSITVAPAQETLAWIEFGGIVQAGRVLVLWRRQPGSPQPRPGTERESRPNALEDAVHNFRALMGSAGLMSGVNLAGSRRIEPDDVWQVLDVGSIPNLCVLGAMLAQLEAGGGPART